MRVSDIAQQLGLSQDQVHEGLDELARASLVRSSFEDPKALRAVPPQVGLAALIASEEQELSERREQLATSKLALERVIDEYDNETRKRPYGGVEHLVGIDSIRSRIESLAADCRQEIMGFAPDGPQTLENMDASKPVDSATLGRGLRMRSIFLESIRRDSASMAYLRWLTAQGAEVRTQATLPNRMIIYDRRIAVLPIDPDKSSVGALVMRGAGVVTALCELFEQMWSAALPLDHGRPLEAPELSPQEQAVLRLLAQGCTDEVIARRLGISVRTSRRITASLLVRLDARSRFQAGFQAALYGWLKD